MFANRISSSTSCSIWLPETSPDRPAVRSGRLKPRRPAPLGTSSVTVFKVATLPIILFGLILAAGLFYVAQHLASDLSVEQFTTFLPFLMLGPFSPELRPHLRPNRSRDE